MGETLAWWAKPRNVSICVDTPGWFDNFAADLTKKISARGDDAILVRNAADVREGGIAFYLSCLRLTPPAFLARNVQNIVVHASALPAGRGFSPIVWQVLEGKSVIPISMILAAEGADLGDILMRDQIVLDGNELNDEIRDRLGQKVVDMCLAYLDAPEAPVGHPQDGEPSWYDRRRPEDSRLDPERTIAEQFDLLRVVDNDRYPAFFEYRGRRYVLRISSEPGEDKQ